MTPVSPDEVTVRAASDQELQEIEQFLQPFVDARQLLSRTTDELRHLLRHAFLARAAGRIVGFAAVEIYSRKLAEIQCLAVAPEMRRHGIGRRLVEQCIARAKDLGVLELMAISASSKFLKQCGFHYALPQQKRALFVQPQEVTEKQKVTE